MTISVPPDSPATETMFKILTPALGPSARHQAARLGRLSLPGRPVMETPGFFAVASRGTIPHVTPDNVVQHTEIPGVFMALEDFIERKEPPIYETPPTPSGALRTFTATPPTLTTLLAARRVPQVPARTGNTDKAVSVFTSTGFTTEPATAYPQHIAQLKPDIAVPLVDLTPTGNTPSSHKRMRKMAYRTEEWLDVFLAELKREGVEKEVAVFAPVLPVAGELQWEYLQRLTEVVRDLEGLALYDERLLEFLEGGGAYEVLAGLPRIALTVFKSPHDVLDAISRGIDIVVPSFVNATSDAGIALLFSFPSSTDEIIPTTPSPSGTDLWDPVNATSLEAILPSCPCYSCTRHHRAFIHHLLNAKEMLGWTLLQLHNFHVFVKFLAGVREAIRTGEFEKRIEIFKGSWEEMLPTGTGSRPRARGYHFKAEAHQVKANKSPWGELGEKWK